MVASILYTRQKLLKKQARQFEVQEVVERNLVDFDEEMEGPFVELQLDFLEYWNNNTINPTSRVLGFCNTKYINKFGII